MSEGWFVRLCAGLDTPGGHMIFCLLLILVGAGMHAAGMVEDGRILIGGATGAALMAMKGQNGRGAKAGDAQPK